LLALFVLASFKVQIYAASPMWRQLGSAILEPLA
jgi:hypothetical protein